MALEEGEEKEKKKEKYTQEIGARIEIARNGGPRIIAPGAFRVSMLSGL